MHFQDNDGRPPVEVAAHLAPHLLAQLRRACDPECDLPDQETTLAVAVSWDALLLHVRTGPVDVVVADPAATGPIDTSTIRLILTRYPSVPILLYTVLTPESLRATVDLARSGARHVVLRGFDDEPRHLRELLERFPTSRLSDFVLRSLEPQLSQAPPALGRAVAQMFDRPHRFHHAADLALAAGMTRRSLDRWLDRAGIAPARTLLVGARLTRALHYLREPGYLLDDVTRKLGGPSGRIFARQVRQATGLTPSALRRIDPESLLPQLSALLRRENGGEE